MVYYYFVSYLFSDSRGSGHGRVIAHLTQPLEYLSDVELIEAQIRRDNRTPTMTITVTNWIPLKGEYRPG